MNRLISAFVRRLFYVFPLVVPPFAVFRGTFCQLSSCSSHSDVALLTTINALRSFKFFLSRKKTKGTEIPEVSNSSCQTHTHTHLHYRERAAFPSASGRVVIH